MKFVYSSAYNTILILPTDFKASVNHKINALKIKKIVFKLIRIYLSTISFDFVFVCSFIRFEYNLITERLAKTENEETKKKDQKEF